MANEVGLPVPAVVKLARRLGDKGVRNRSSVISPIVAKQIRQKHNIKSSAALRTRRDHLARSAASRQLSKAEQQEFRELVSVFGLPLASSLRSKPKPGKSGPAPTPDSHQSSGSGMYPQERRTNKATPSRKPVPPRPIGAVAIATLAHELCLSTDYISMLAKRHISHDDLQHSTVPVDVAKVIRRDYGPQKTAAKRKRYQLLDGAHRNSPVMLI
ncbi:hypothetical protein R4227_21980 [Gordonia amicalis]|uniref:hypothetical protein n=1 Tax=Gordonia amicalis TaxID=89053 RepID=UPI0029550C35|nr:hypothetical protein [Gordonia amicalis]MDV7102692.1 hypothetical protein [Gordonia amicalis]